jgi:small-conductance mechanosensitive channel
LLVQSWDDIDLQGKVETVRRKTRPWKAIIALLLAIIAAVISFQSRRGDFFDSGLDHVGKDLVSSGAAILFCVFASIATLGIASRARQIIEPRAGNSHAAIFRYATLLIGGFITLLLTLELFGVPIGQLVLGGALTSVFVGIAAQQALSNVFAGLVLLFARPFRVGDEIRLRAGALGGQIEGIVADIGVTYVRINSDGTTLNVPNSQVLNAVVGPVPLIPDEEPPARQPATAASPAAEPVAAGDGKSLAPGGPQQQGPRPPGPA